MYYRLGNRHYENYPKPMLVEVKPQDVWLENWREWLPKSAIRLGSVFNQRRQM
ncbi:hypothetical protein [Pseudomonas fluorescens]|uniref:hypothetical protein n=1 Tax=Pseudomonas fluorescens TaxID=294 RepID=UPI002966AAC2|nr:hypothetical protein [Pseudomonas fluorescens]